MKKTYLYIIIAGLLFLGLSLSHFFDLRSTLLGNSPAQPLTIKITDTQFVADQLTVTWQLNTTVPRSTDQTGLYWGPVSTPSALPTSASPQAVGYSHFTSDYQTGQYFLPDTFTATIDLLAQTDIIYYRAYAKLGNAHYWTDQYSVNLNE